MKKLPSKGIDFLHAQQDRKAARAPVGGKKFLLAALPIVLLAGGMGIFGLLSWQHYQYSLRSESLAQAVGAMDTDSVYQRALAAQAQAAALQKQVDSARAVRDAIDSYPSLSAELFGVIRASTLDGMRLDDLTYADGTLSIAGTASRIDDTAAYVARLRTSGYFLGVDYTGYVQRGDTEGTESYQFQITALLKGREGASNGQ